MRIWRSNYRNIQYYVLIIIPSYDDHHVHESQSFKSLIYSFKSLKCSLVRERNHINHTKKAWFLFIFDLLLFMRIWCSNYRNMQYWFNSNHVLIIIPSYDVYHVHESQSDGMDHQWFQNTIVIDIIKIDFFLHNIS